ncbi:chitinase [Aeromicrobium sp. CF3.5]|uniref:chitinase n=1 Tax=Aeromicrobium sp. CF3.5 TaxID=3373078 RepID=UPI003EE4AED8
MAVVVAGALAFSALSGVRWFEDSQAASTGTTWFAGYADVTVTPQFEFEDPASRAARHVVLSFVVASAEDPCDPSWGGAYSLDDASKELDLDRRVARLRQSSGEPVVSFGGAINDELATACTDPAQLLGAYRDVVDRYDLRVIDLDIEGPALSDAAASERRATAIAALQAERAAADKDLRVWLTLPVTPAGLTIEGRQNVATLLDNDVQLSGVNLMTMNYGDSRVADQSMAEASISALNTTHQQLQAVYSENGTSIGSATLWKRMGATPMIGQNDLAGEIFDVQDARELNRFARSKGLARLSMWSLNRDLTCGANYPDIRVVSNSCSGVEQGDVTFADVLGASMKDRPGGAAVTPTAPAGAPAEAIDDDPLTSPYAIWDPAQTYLEGTRVVWHRNVYVATWWTQSDVPDDPTVDVSSSPWQLVGPVLPGEKPIEVPTLPAGTYPAWDDERVYEKGERILFEGVAFRAKWWNQGDNPTSRTGRTEPSPWIQLAPADLAEAAGSPRQSSS